MTATRTHINICHNFSPSMRARVAAEMYEASWAGGGFATLFPSVICSTKNQKRMMRIKSAIGRAARRHTCYTEMHPHMQLTHLPLVSTLRSRTVSSRIIDRSPPSSRLRSSNSARKNSVEGAVILFALQAQRDPSRSQETKQLKAASKWRTRPIEIQHPRPSPRGA